MSEGLPGTPLFVSGTVRSLDGAPVGGAVLDVWQADEDGAYEAQLPVDEARLRAKYTTREDGTYCVRTIAPKGYAIPMDGPVGDADPADRHQPLPPRPRALPAQRAGLPAADHPPVRGGRASTSTATWSSAPSRSWSSASSTTSRARRPTAARSEVPWLAARYDFVLQPA